MKIGLLLDGWEPCIGGVITSTKSLQKGLEMLGHKVYIITLNSYPIKKEIKHGPYILKLKGGIPLFLKGAEGYRLVLRYKKFLPQIEALNLDVIHVHTEAGIGHLGLYASSQLKLPLVYTMHSMYHFFIEKNNFIWLKIFKKIILKYLDYLLKKFISKANVVVVPTQKTLSFLKERYKIEKNYQIIPTGISLEKFGKENYSSEEISNLKEKLGLKNFFVCLFIGRISKEKSIDHNINNFSAFHKQNKKSKFLIIGDGPEKKNLQKQVKKLNLKNKIIFLNFVPNEKVGLYYQLGDVFINSSLFETQGLTYIEALASSLPIVARYDEALEGVIQNGENGFFYSNEKEFVQILNILSNDKEKYKKISLQAQKSVHNYKQEIFAKKMINIYQTVIYENKKRLENKKI
ncbi:MAG: glycosyltransferase [Candidatus Phytoplasma stylosanthis]|nr:glycosyltransferase [Candidatus Phytoplasma stylosanthis]